MAEVELQQHDGRIERRLLMFGRTGAGMTSTANNILSEAIFEERADTRSKTQLCEFAQRTIHGQRLTVFDTPGFFNTERIQQHTEWEIDRSVPMAAPGLHAFVLVISMTNRFPPEAQETIKRIEAKFGKEIYKYLVVVFTGKDTLDSERRDFNDFLRNGIHPMIEDVLNKCNNRCVAFNNKADAQENCNQVKTLLDVIDGMVEQNNGGFYSAEDFGKTSQRLRRKLASYVLSIQEHFHFNLGMFQAVVSIMMLVVLLGSVFALAWLLLGPTLSPTVPEPDTHRHFPDISENGTKPPSDTNHPKTKPHRNIVDELIYFHVLLTVTGQGFSVLNEKSRCLLPCLNPSEPILPLPHMQSYVYTQVLYNALGRGVCLLHEDNRCFPRWFQPVTLKRTTLDLTRIIYARVMFSAVNRGWSLPENKKKTGLRHFSPFELQTFKSSIDIYDNNYARCIYSAIRRGWSLSEECNETNLGYFGPDEPKPNKLLQKVWKMLGY